MKKILLGSAALMAIAMLGAQAQTTWDGGGGADTSWGNASNWNTDTLPAFNGTDSLTVTAPLGANTSLTLGANRSIGRITFGAGATALSLSGNTLILSNTTTTAATGTALWNANTADNITATVNSGLLLQSGTSGNYTGHFREDNNSSGGTRFNGAIAQGAGETWTLRFSRANQRGQFFLNNASNSIFAIRNDGADVYSETMGAFGGASLTLAGGFTGTRVSDHYTTAVSNNITMAGNASWVSQSQTRLTGHMSQSTFNLNYGGSLGLARDVLTRLEYASFAGTGATTISAGAVAANSMSNFSTGTLNIGNSTGTAAAVVLSGSAGNGVPTWADFSSSKTYNQSGGNNTWRIDSGTAGANSGPFGGFAARGSDLIIPASGGGLGNSTFARNFLLGSMATLDGVQYAANAVNIQTDIAYGNVTGSNRYFAIAGNQGSSKNATLLTLAGPVHELSGQITGQDVVIYPMGLSNTQQGVVRISNANNSLTGNSRWIIGGSRSTFTTLAGTSIAAANNMGDFSSVVLVFTSDGAFGGAAEVNVASQNSSSQAPSGTLLFEDVNGSGSTTFTRNINLQQNSVNSSPAWGSYGGEVIYTGTATMGGSVTGGNSIIHVQSGVMDLGVAGGSAATITNNMGNGSFTTFNKSGSGTLRIQNLTLNGTQTLNQWNVRQGTMLVNTSLSSGNVTVSSGGTLGGNGTINGNLTVLGGATLAPGNSPGLLTVSGALGLNSTSSTVMEINGTATRGVDFDGINIGSSLTYGGNLTLNFGLTLGAGSYSWNLFDFGGQSGSFSNVLLAGAYSGSLTNTLGVWGLTSGLNTWTFTQSTGDLSLVVAIPEPSTYVMVLGGLAALVYLRRRSKKSVS